ncbi:Uncharacterized membrane protein [Natronorubrum sediminis]|uniref:Uncharacterized membrane protein n=1 Tax=Natronorubrum sediminis TaxID=640943 RepID=A0A1H6FX51_9EURY|nr:DUF63 family protein [Natronorubrum sediminis]SEH14345.1 Uncharacterized membrane protein [Natronorubrum sediminis]
MDEYIERYGAERLWVATVVLLAGGIALAAFLFPQRVYVDFIWQYYWGPVVADAHGWNCVTWADGDQLECTEVTGDDGPTASPGYTAVSYAGYIPTLILMAVGILFAIRRLDIDRYRAGFFALFPFMLFGGALRTVEDANVAAYGATGDLAIQLPWSGFLISPLIYFTVALIAVVAVVASVWLERNEYVSGYEYPLFGIGTVVLAVTLGWLGYLAAVTDYVGFIPSIAAIVLVAATVSTAIVWAGIQRFAPSLNRGTGYMGIVVIWAHAVDGFANQLMLDWSHVWGLAYAPKHPVNDAIVTHTEAVLDWLFFVPAGLTDTIGDAWPFALLKLAAPVFIIWIFNEEIFEESPRFAILMMITVVAVGLGPGTRDMLRATFAI